MKIMEAVDDQVRQRGRRHRKCRHVDATLALDHQLVGRNDPDGYQAIEPRRELDGWRPLAANEVAQPRHGAASGCCPQAQQGICGRGPAYPCFRLVTRSIDHLIVSFAAISRTVTAITATDANSPHL